jgi:hypothetical protein
VHSETGNQSHNNHPKSSNDETSTDSTSLLNNKRKKNAAGTSSGAGSSRQSDVDEDSSRPSTALNVPVLKERKKRVTKKALKDEEVLSS